MKLQDDPFIALGSGLLADPLNASAGPALPAMTAGLVLGCLRGFDVLDQPLVAELAGVPSQIVVARSTVRLRRAMVGSQVVVCFEQGDPLRPIVIGVVEPQPLHEAAPGSALHAEVDGERHVIEAGRELVLRCGEASITLTRAGKILINGSYILSRSKGYNKIKGAAIDIN